MYRSWSSSARSQDSTILCWIVILCQRSFLHPDWPVSHDKTGASSSPIGSRLPRTQNYHLGCDTLSCVIRCPHKYHLANWYQKCNLPATWRIVTTENRWTTNEKGLDWIRHLDFHTTSRTKGKYRLLILHGCHK